MASYFRTDRDKDLALLTKSRSLVAKSRGLLALPVYPFLPRRQDLAPTPSPDPTRAALSDLAEHAGQAELWLAYEVLSMMEALIPPSWLQEQREESRR